MNLGIGPFGIEFGSQTHMGGYDIGQSLRFKNNGGVRASAVPGFLRSGPPGPELRSCANFQLVCVF